MSDSVKIGVVELENTTPPSTEMSSELDAETKCRLITQIAQLRGMTSEEVIRQGRQASQMLTWGYLLRGACAAELIARAEKAPAGRGKKDHAGNGINAQLERMAQSVGVSARTLRDDARIYTTFFAPDLEAAQDQAEIGDADILRFGQAGRDHFRAALSSPEPVKFLAQEIEAAQGPLSVQSLRRKTKCIASASKSEPTSLPDKRVGRDVYIEDTKWLDMLVEKHNAIGTGRVLTHDEYVMFLVAHEAGRVGLDIKLNEILASYWSAESLTWAAALDAKIEAEARRPMPNLIPD